MDNQWGQPSPNAFNPDLAAAPTNQFVPSMAAANPMDAFQPAMNSSTNAKRIKVALQVAHLRRSKGIVPWP